MMRSIAFFILASFFFCASAQAQTLSDSFVRSLNEQGFVIESTGYTWLRRIVVTATNGVHNREIVIARGSEQILQDNWQPVSQSNKSEPTNQPTSNAKPPKPSSKNNGAGKGNSGGQNKSNGKGGSGGKSGQGGNGGKPK